MDLEMDATRRDIPRLLCRQGTTVLLSHHSIGIKAVGLRETDSDQSNQY
jgi:hypothetical protein